MDAMLLLKFAVAFIFVISLMLLLSFVMKRLGLSGQVMDTDGKRRLKVVEYLPLDHRRRLALVRCDEREYLLVLGTNSETVIETGTVKEVKHA